MYLLNCLIQRYFQYCPMVVSCGWGIFEIQEIERIHLYALKRFFNVSLHTSNNKVYAETGRFPLSINLNIKSIKYWFKIRNLESTRIVNQSYQCLLNMCNNGHSNWVSIIRDLLFH